jgi:ATP-binding cassette subfamily G (WHITE) protein 2
MMVKYHQEHGHLYRLSNTDQDDSNRRGTSLYDQDEAMDTYNYDDVSSPLRFTSSNRQHSNNNISTNGLDAHHDHQPGSTFRDVEGNPHNPRSAKNSALQHDLTTLQVFFRQLRTLTSRSWITFIRTKMMLPLKVGQVILSAIIVIALYYQFEYNQQSVLQRSSCMYLLIIIQIFATVLSVALTFPNERGVFMNEQSSRSYSVIPYFISKLLIDVPILTICIFMFSIITYFPIKLTLAFDRFIIYCLVLESVSLIGHGLGLIVASVVPSPSMAVLFAPMTIAPFILFSHIAIPSGYVLPFLRPLMWLSPFYWGLDALMINEFKGIRLGCTDEELYAVPSVAQGLVYICRFETAKDALDSYSIKLDMLWPSIFALYGISAGLICIAGGILWYLSKSISSAVKLRPATHH